MGENAFVLAPISFLWRRGSDTPFLRLSPPPALMMDTKAKPCCLLLSVLFTDANPHCSSSRVSQGIKCALWKHVHLKVLWRSGSELLNGDGFSHPSLPLFFPCLSLLFSFPRRKHRLRTPITRPRIPVPKAGFFQTQQI